jgi:hypothetical protein
MRNRGARLYEPLKNYVKQWSGVLREGLPVLQDCSAALLMFESRFDILGENFCNSREKILAFVEVQETLEVIRLYSSNSREKRGPLNSVATI